MAIKLIAIDMDGTLLLPTTPSLLPLKTRLPLHAQKASMWC
jgi:hydroxymethylpyrimidine pyrophosphatase-like HAD family hydrolase